MCSIGCVVNDKCDGDLVDGATISAEDRFLLEVRSGAKAISKVCARHENIFGSIYEARQKKCCRPVEGPTCRSATLRTVSVDQYFVWKPFCPFIAPGQKICSNCRSYLTSKVAEAQPPVLVSKVEDDFKISPSQSPPTLSPMHIIIQKTPDVNIPKKEEAVEVYSSPLGADSHPQLPIPMGVDQQTPSSTQPQHPQSSQEIFSEEGNVGSEDLFSEEDTLKETVDKTYESLEKAVPYLRSIETSQASSVVNVPEHSATSSASETWSSPHVDYWKDICNELATLLNVELDTSKIKLKSYRIQKLIQLQSAIRMAIFRAGGEKETESKSAINIPVDTDEAFKEMISQVKTKFSEAEDAKTKIQLLSVLPSSWSERHLEEEFHVNRKLIRRMKELVADQGILPEPYKKMGSRTLSNQTIDLVKKFFEDPEISREMPGKKDFKSVRIGGKREHKQKRLVLMNLSEAYEEFRKSHKDTKIGFSKFAELRPAHCVLAGASGTHSVCVCSTHENFRLMVAGAHLDSGSTGYSLENCVKHVLCSNPTEDCYFQQCQSCPGAEVLRENLEVLFDERMVEEIVYQQWTKTDRCTLERVVSKTGDFIDKFLEILPSIVLHDYISKKQSKYFKESKANLKPGEVVVVADFSENYSFVVQDATQGFHWNNEQATIHPFSCYYKPSDGEEVECLSLVCISDYLTHNTAAVYGFQKRLVAFLKEKVPNLKKIKYFSDGAASQYKNRKNVRNLAYHMRDFGIQAEWHYFATAHGKGPSDGLGGCLKRLAARASLQMVGASRITSPIELYNWAKETIQGISFIFVPSEEMKEITEALKSRFDEAVAVPKIMKVHAVLPVNEEAIVTKPYSSSAVRNLVSIKPTERITRPSSRRLAGSSKTTEPNLKKARQK